MLPMPDSRRNAALDAIRMGMSALLPMKLLMRLPVAGLLTGLLWGLPLTQQAAAQAGQAADKAVGAPMAPMPMPLAEPAAPASSAPATRAVPSAPAAPPPPSNPTPAARTPPPQKQTPKPGPGENDAGAGAASLQTTTLSLFGLIDRKVVGRQRRQIGHVVDVLVNAKGEPAALIVDVGGFMGMGNRRIAVGWDRFALAGPKPGDALQLPFSDAQIKAAPAYGGSKDVIVVQGVTHHIAASPPKPSAHVVPGEDLGPLSTDQPASANALNPD